FCAVSTQLVEGNIFVAPAGHRLTDSTFALDWSALPLPVPRRRKRKGSCRDSREGRFDQVASRERGHGVTPSVSKLRVGLATQIILSLYSFEKGRSSASSWRFPRDT